MHQSTRKIDRTLYCCVNLTDEKLHPCLQLIMKMSERAYMK